jgi:glycosyltransferase involved in cell wall biosynthesis
VTAGTLPLTEGVAAPSQAGALAGRRVLIIVENLPVPFDRRVWQEARTLRAAGAAVSVVCPTGPGCESRFEVLDGVEIHRHALPAEADGVLGYLREYAAAFVAQTRLAWQVFLGRGFDTIHACNPPDLIFLVALPFKLIGCRFIFDHHDLCPELYEAKFGRRGPAWRVLRLLERLTFRLADAVISTNESYRRIALDRGGVAPERAHVVRSGPDLERLRPVPPRAHHRNGRRFLVGYVGVMGRQEGIDLLLAAAAHVVYGLGRDDVQFCLVGGGPSLEAMRALSVRLGLRYHVAFLGRVPDDGLIEVLSTADVCVNPDRACALNDLSTMNKVLEYMALGRPVVQFESREGRVSAGAASSYARPDDPVDLAEKIVSLLDRPALREAMGRLGRERMERALSWRHQAPALIAAYRAAAPSRRPSMQRRPVV